MLSLINLPGIENSDAHHWQSIWESGDPAFARIAPTSWTEPELGDWLTALDAAVDQVDHPPVLVGHSLGCLLAAHWAARGGMAAGAFLVGVPDPTADGFPPPAASFGNLPREPISFPTLIIASSDDPYTSPDTSRRDAADWGAALIEVGALGHMGHASELGGWDQGRSLLTAFCAGLSAP